jgi:lipid II:glycine glycyltransferase (peptidoglycan interpeptide bridge formation enzyme)
MRHEKVERNQALYQYHIDHPEATFNDIGKQFGDISRSRVGQLIQRGVKTAKE